MDVQILQVELEKQVILMLLLDHPKHISYEIQQKETTFTITSNWDGMIFVCSPG